MSLYQIGIPFASINTDLLILILGFLFLELTYKLALKKNNHSDIIFSEKTSEIEKILWFLLIGSLLYVISIPLLSTEIYYFTSKTISGSIIFQNLKPHLLSYFFNIGELISSSSTLINPALYSVLSIFALVLLISLFYRVKILTNKKIAHKRLYSFFVYAILTYLIFDFTLVLIIQNLVLRILLILPIISFILIITIGKHIKIQQHLSVVKIIGATLILVLIITLIFIYSYSYLLRPQFTITNYDIIKNGGYILSGNPIAYHHINESVIAHNYINESTYQNFTVYNITPVLLNITIGNSNFAYFKLYENITTIKNINKLIHTYSLPGYAYNPKYSCALSSEFICNETNMSIKNTTMPYLIINNIKNRSIRPLIPLKLGPLNDTVIAKVLNVTRPTYSCSSSLCYINFSIKNKANASLVIDTLSIPYNQRYNLSDANISVNSVKTQCSQMIPNSEIECIGPSGFPTIFLSQAYSPQNNKILSVYLVSLARKSYANFTIILK
jgi:hypothetical protein